MSQTTNQQQTLPYKLNGIKSSSTLLVFIHGFPNTMKIWSDYISSFQNSHLILSLSFPNYVPSEIALDNQEERSEVTESYWGISTKEVILRMKATIDSVNKEKRKVVFIGHDLGAYFSFGFDKEFPNYIEKMVILDVSFQKEDKFELNTLVLLIYQLTLSFCFLLGYPIGDFYYLVHIKTML